MTFTLFNNSLRSEKAISIFGYFFFTSSYVHLESFAASSQTISCPLHYLDSFHSLKLDWESDCWLGTDRRTRYFLGIAIRQNKENSVIKIRFIARCSLSECFTRFHIHVYLLVSLTIWTHSQYFRSKKSLRSVINSTKISVDVNHDYLSERTTMSSISVVLICMWPSSDDELKDRTIAQILILDSVMFIERRLGMRTRQTFSSRVMWIVSQTQLKKKQMVK
jgi:hypothetical protein